MESKPGLIEVTRKLCLLALFGFVAITLAGPILAVLFVVLSFALVGFLFWLPIQTLVLRKDAGLRAGLEKGREVAHRGLQIAGGVWGGTVRLGRDLHEGLRGTVSFVGAVLLEGLSGALVGVLLVSVCWPGQAPPTAGGLAALLGALTGVLVVLSRRRPARDALVEQSPEGVN